MQHVRAPVVMLAPTGRLLLAALIVPATPFRPSAHDSLLYLLSLAAWLSFCP